MGWLDKAKGFLMSVLGYKIPLYGVIVGTFLSVIVTDVMRSCNSRDGSAAKALSSYYRDVNMIVVGIKTELDEEGKRYKEVKDEVKDDATELSDSYVNDISALLRALRDESSGTGE